MRNALEVSGGRIQTVNPQTSMPSVLGYACVEGMHSKVY